jgi:uncharacterized membrane protein YGL010W
MKVLLVLVRIEPYFFIAFVVTYGLINVHFAQPEFGLTMGLVPALLVQVAMTIFFTRSENAVGAIVAIVSSSSHEKVSHRTQALILQFKILRLGEMAYLITRILLLKGHGWFSKTALKDEQLLFASVALGLASLACITAIVCVFNFHKGLKPLLLRSSWKETPHEFEPIHEHRYAERIELD